MKFDDYPVVHGHPDEWNDFHERNPRFLGQFKNLLKAKRVAFDVVRENTILAQRTVYFLGLVIVEEFMEILTLCGNGYGVGAQKLIRGMFERAVTAHYLLKHPEQAQDFRDYGAVADYKLLQSLRSSGRDSTIPEERQAEIAQKYESVKDRFLITSCEECGTTRVNHTWNKKDVVSMARESEGLRALLPHAYHIPTGQFHSTMSSNPALQRQLKMPADIVEVQPDSKSLL